MSLKGYLVVLIKTSDGEEVITIPGEEFSWEEGGEYDSRFMMKYKDPQDRFEVYVEFETEGTTVFNWRVRPTEASVKVVEDELEVPERFLNYDPQSF